MEPLLKQLGELPRKLAMLPLAAKLGAGALLVLGLLGGVLLHTTSDDYQYAYTNLATDDSAEISAQLKGLGVPFRFEAGGSALAVPASRVYDVRLLLASAGLPRNSGSGMELFDKGDFGQSEFTQKVNLQRATEGELARTISRFAGVKSARVHVVLPEKGVFRGQERPASAAVVLSLQPGRVLDERELAGLRHLVSSAVPALSPDAVTVVDQRGGALTAGAEDGAESFQQRSQRELEQKVVSLLEPVVGVGQVVARATVEIETSEVTRKQHAVDPENVAPLTERTVTSTQQQQSGDQGGVAGAAANQPLKAQGTSSGNQQRSNSSSQEESKSYDVSHVDTTSVQKDPRIARISMAILLDGSGSTRTAAEVQRLGELARSAVGLNAERGDKLEISSAAFTHAAAVEPAPVTPMAASMPAWAWGAIGAGVLAVAALLGVSLRRKKAEVAQPLVLRPGASVAELEGGAPRPSLAPVEQKALPDPSAPVRERARELAKADPLKTAQLLRTWLNPEPGAKEQRHA